MHLLWTVFLILLMSGMPSYTQLVQEFPVKEYPFENQSFIHNFARDKDGYLWFSANNGGAYRFDGKNYLPFNKKHGLTNMAVSHIYSDSRGILWFCTFKDGLYGYDGTSFHKFIPPGNSGLYEMAESCGYLWIISRDKLLRFDGRNFSVALEFRNEKLSFMNIAPDGGIYLMTSKTKDSPRKLYLYDGKKLVLPPLLNAAKDLESFSLDSKGGVWLGFTGKIARLQAGKLTEITFDREKKDNKVLTIVTDKNGNAWFRTRYGLYFCGGKTVEQVTSRNNSEMVFQEIYSDYEGNLWAGTRGKIKKFNKPGFSLSTETILPEYSFLFEDRKGRIWFSDAYSFSVYDGKNTFSYTAPEEGANKFSGTQGENNTYWFAYGNRLVKFSDGKFSLFINKNKIAPGKAGPSTVSVAADNKGNVFILYTGYFISRFDGKTFTTVSLQKNNQTFRRLLANVFHWKYIFTGGESIQVYDGRKFREITFRNKGTEYSSIRIRYDAKRIFILQVLKNKKNELVIIDLKNGSVKKITEQDGLASGGIMEFEIDPVGDDLWMGHAVKGFGRMDLKEFEKSGRAAFSFYPFENGFENAMPVHFNFDSRGFLWTKTLMGWIKFKPAELIHLNNRKATLVISGIRLFFGNHDLSKYAEGGMSLSGIPVKLRLPYNENFVTFEFSALSFRDPDAAEYSFKLDGLEKQWSPFRKVSEASYTNLPAGNYTFLVKARLKNGTFTNIASYSFSIAPPFWSTWWFILACISAGAGIVYFIVRFRLNKVQARKLEELVNIRTLQLREEMEKVELQNAIIQEEKERVQSMNTELEKSRYQLSKINEVQTRWLEELSESERSLKEMNKSKDKFFSIISHDLKSPFSSMVRYTEMMLREFEKLTPAEVREYIASLNRSTQHVYEFIEDLLEWSRIQTGRIDFQPMEYELSSQIKEVAYLNSGSLMKKNITLVNFITEKTTVFADENMVRSVLNNLISNALKFTHEGGTIELSLSLTDDFAEVSVKDNGIGMTDEQISELFIPDKRRVNIGTANEKGTGLGLILCREFIEKNGGMLTMESRPGEGSTFKFTLPLSRVAAEKSSILQLRH